MLKKYLLFLSFTMLIFISSSVFAQEGGGDGPPAPGGGPGGATPPPNSIDGGLGILLAIGVGYAVKKLRKED